MNKHQQTDMILGVDLYPILFNYLGKSVDSIFYRSLFTKIWSPNAFLEGFEITVTREVEND